MSGIILASFISTVVITIYGSFKFTNSDPVKWIVLYCIAGSVIEIFSNTLAINGISNIFLYCCLVWIETFVLLFYFISISETISKFPQIWLLLPIYLILLLIWLFLDNSKSLSPYSGIFQSLLIFTLGLISFNDELRAARYSDILREPFFWFVASLVLYYGCSSIVLIGAKVFSVDKIIFNYIWNYQNLLNILKNIMIAVGFILFRK